MENCHHLAHEDSIYHAYGVDEMLPVTLIEHGQLYQYTIDKLL